MIPPRFLDEESYLLMRSIYTFCWSCYILFSYRNFARVLAVMIRLFIWSFYYLILEWWPAYFYQWMDASLWKAAIGSNSTYSHSVYRIFSTIFSCEAICSRRLHSCYWASNFITIFNTNNNFLNMRKNKFIYNNKQ